ncbi:MAG: hypothetical protein QG628_237 [Patescibacteria group bacterium]|nr:hypothetical protein [Patescibacteria group bacterium]
MGQVDEPTSANAISQKKPRNRTKTILLSLGVVLLVLIGAGLGYLAGLQKGKELAKQEITKKVTDLLNPLNVLSSNPLFPNSVVGKVTTANATEITIKQINGESKKVTVDKDTQVTKQSKEVTASDIKAENEVTVILKKDSDTATRIIIR